MTENGLHVVYMSSLGFVLPNVIAAALASQGRNAGSAAALLGTAQFGAGAVIGMLLGALGNGTAVPMAGLIARADSRPSPSTA